MPSHICRRTRWLALCALLLFPLSARADIDPNSGIDFVRIGAVGNAPWMGDGTPGDRAIGRGRVNYEYFIGRFEVTTAQWVEFFNAAFDRPANDRLPHLFPPSFWGATSAPPTVQGGERWTVPPGQEMVPTGNISWRMAAMYCNWLHNNKSTARSAFLNGAYDVSTFGFGGPTGVLDQRAHHPGARYWIPTWDEWLKAAHYDPNKHGPNQGGYWLYSTTSDTAPVSGPPPSMGGMGQMNAGGWSSQFPNISTFEIRLGAYTTVTSPWGLFDVAGGTAEWTEEVIRSSGIDYRQYNGSWWFDGSAVADRIGVWSGDFPNLSTFEVGFRVASVVPAPSSGAGAGIAFIALCARARRRAACVPGGKTHSHH